jgi:tetratricopeptide (TPR) repeat protein
MKLKKLRLIFIIAIINVSCGNENINDLKEKADRLCIDQEYLGAISLYNVVLQIDANHYDAYAQRAKSKFNTGDVRGALEDINSALSLKKPGIYYYHKARFERHLNLLDSSLKSYTTAIKNDSNLFEAYNNRGLLYQKNGKFEKALNDFNKTIEISSDFSIGYNNRGILLQEIDKHDKAIKDFNSAISYDSNISFYYYNRATSFVSIQNIDAAFKDLIYAKEIDPDNSLVWNDLGIIYKYTEEIELACDHWKKALSLGNQNSSYYINKYCL